MTLTQAYHELQEKRAIINRTLKEINQLKTTITKLGGTLERPNFQVRNEKIHEGWLAGKTYERLAIFYNLGKAKITAICQREDFKIYQNRPRFRPIMMPTKRMKTH